MSKVGKGFIVMNEDSTLTTLCADFGQSSTFLWGVDDGGRSARCAIGLGTCIILFIRGIKDRPWTTPGCCMFLNFRHGFVGLWGIPQAGTMDSALS